MKANRPRQFGLIVLGASILAFATCCSDQRIVPPPAPAPLPAPRPAPPPVPRPPVSADWRDAPITPGDWRWSMEGSRSVARFGGDTLVLSCNRDAAAITLMRPGIAEGQVPFTIVTSFSSRPLSATGIAGPPPVLAVTLQARDSLLDAMAFSRGRFAVETAGLPTLYVPSWPEVSRVIEDCR